MPNLPANHISNRFQVIYRAGGTERCVWRRLSELHLDREAAQVVASDLERSGFHALIATKGEWDRNGLPIGWEPKSVNWDQDDVRISPDTTYHASA